MEKALSVCAGFYMVIILEITFALPVPPEPPMRAQCPADADVDFFLSQPIYRLLCYNFMGSWPNLVVLAYRFPLGAGSDSVKEPRTGPDAVTPQPVT